MKVIIVSWCLCHTTFPGLGPPHDVRLLHDVLDPTVCSQLLLLPMLVMPATAGLWTVDLSNTSLDEPQDKARAPLQIVREGSRASSQQDEAALLIPRRQGNARPSLANSPCCRPFAQTHWLKMRSRAPLSDRMADALLSLFPPGHSP